MDIVLKLRRIILQFVGGVVFAFGLGICVWCFCFLPAIILDVSVISVKTMFYLMFFWAFPVGGLWGIFVVDKLIFKSPSYNVLGIIIGLLLSFLGMGLGFLAPAILHVSTNILIFFLPSICALFSLIGYNSVGLFIHEGEKPTAEQKQ